LTDEGFLDFVFRVFMPLFGKKTDFYVEEYVSRQEELQKHMTEGGNAFFNYVRNHAPPVFPPES